MQPQTSKSMVAAKSSSTVSKSKVATSQQQISRNRTTSDNAGTVGGRMLILYDGKNVTPKSLTPANPAARKDGKSGEEGAPGADGEKPMGETPDDAATSQAAPPPTQANRAKPAKPPGLSKMELEKTVEIILTETDTDTLLHFPSTCVALDNVQATSVAARNKAYEELCSSKADSDRYREQHAQTLNNHQKAKEVLAAPPAQESVEVNANGWDIWDTFSMDPVPKHVQIQQACEKESTATVAAAIKKPGCLFSMNEPYPSEELQKPKEAATGKRHGGHGDGKSGRVAGGKSKGLSGGTSKAMSGGGVASGPTSDSLGLAGGGTSGVGPSSGTEAEGSAVVAGEAAPGGAPDPSQEATDDEKAVPAPMALPWKIGANNPIPEALSESLRVMERIVSQNVFHKQHMIYRNYPTLEELAKLDEKRDITGLAAGTASLGEAGSGTRRGRGSIRGPSADGSTAGERPDDDPDAAAEEGQQVQDVGVGTSDRDTSGQPYLQDLFCFAAPQLTQGVTVTSAEWNRHNEDLLAVSYGDTSPVPNVTGGLVLFWSLKNPTYPERVIRTRSGVTALHFSTAHPNLVAAGMHDGAVMIWDLRRPTDTPMLASGSSTSTHNDRKHTDIVWETRWVDRGPDKQPPELLVSASSDGNIFQWTMKKGLDQASLMGLKRLQNPNLGSNSVYGHKEGIVFRKSSGFCVDFPRNDPSTYLVGTEDGLIHRCSTSLNEQYLATYYGHSGPVYRVRCNPFVSHAFLSCSADWTMRLWTTKPMAGHVPTSPLQTFQSTDLSDSVNDVIWAPHSSTSFAAAMDDGRVELWDLSINPVDAIVVHYPQNLKHQRRRTCVRFSPNSPVLVAGDDEGCVDVMRMYNTDTEYYSDQEQQDRLNARMSQK